MKKKSTPENAGNILTTNNALYNKVYAAAMEDAYFQADEILSYFRHYNEATQKSYDTLKDYSIDSCAAYVKANNRYYKEFINDCITVNEMFGIMENIKDNLTRVYNKIDLYDDLTAGYGDISDANYKRLENWINNTIDAACEAIANAAQEFYTQFDDENVLNDYFITFWLDYNDLEVDDTGTVYETIIHEYK